MQKQYTSHIIHFIVTVCTFGWWIPIWILMGLINMRHNAKVEDYHRDIERHVSLGKNRDTNKNTWQAD